MTPCPHFEDDVCELCAQAAQIKVLLRVIRRHHRIVSTAHPRGGNSVHIHDANRDLWALLPEHQKKEG